jgi:hypothetical protein
MTTDLRLAFRQLRESARFIFLDVITLALRIEEIGLLVYA